MEWIVVMKAKKWEAIIPDSEPIRALIAKSTLHTTVGPYQKELAMNDRKLSTRSRSASVLLCGGLAAMALLLLPGCSSFLREYGASYEPRSELPKRVGFSGNWKTRLDQYVEGYRDFGSFTMRGEGEAGIQMALEEAARRGAERVTISEVKEMEASDTYSSTTSYNDYGWMRTKTTTTRKTGVELHYFAALDVELYRHDPENAHRWGYRIALGDISGELYPSHLRRFLDLGVDPQIKVDDQSATDILAKIIGASKGTYFRLKWKDILETVRVLRSAGVDLDPLVPLLDQHLSTAPNRAIASGYGRDMAVKIRSFIAGDALASTPRAEESRPTPKAEVDRKLGASELEELAARVQAESPPDAGADEHVVLTFNTAGGEQRVVIDLFEEDAPRHATNFKALARSGFFVGLKPARRPLQNMRRATWTHIPFARWEEARNELHFTIPAEIGHKHVRGAIAALRQGDKFNPEKRSIPSSFMICLKDVPFWDKWGNTVFGQVIGDTKVLDRIVLGDEIIATEVVAAADIALLEQ